MDIAPTPNILSQPVAPAPATEEPAISSDFDTYLTLLTAQLENQDPLNPIESQDFATQLATFSGVEQQVLTNDLLEQLISGTGSLTDFASWVGMEARAPVAAEFSGDAIEIFPDFPPNADRFSIVVRDADGAEVTRFAIPSDGAPIAWSGTDASGKTAEDGLYTFTVVGFAGDAQVGERTADVYARVTEARLDEGEVVLAFAGGGTAAASTVEAVRSPVEAS
ncbi:MAG: flagellar hook capping FlgD N-terminal domain-containing protein [Pseudomonadota bacterium]